jgi:hypothetical protein
MSHPDALPVITPRIVPFGMRCCQACKYWLAPYSISDPKGWCAHPFPEKRLHVTGAAGRNQLKGGGCNLFETRQK